jgi:hypothetical protein
MFHSIGSCLPVAVKLFSIFSRPAGASSHSDFGKIGLLFHQKGMAVYGGPEPTGSRSIPLKTQKPSTKELLCQT